MHNIEPYYNWRHLYTAEEDEYSPFYGREYSEFVFSNSVYNYYIHPQWDEFGSHNLYMKILFTDYQFNFTIIELLGEWNDAIDNDIMTMKRNILDTLIAVGLGYVKLGQETQSLSGGEAQRLKLSRELAKRSTGQTLYLLDEPTTGLHSEDIMKLLGVLHKLVNKGNTMIIIEHHLDVIKNADYIIDLGPGAGDKRGTVVATGSPEEIAATPKSLTGQFLKQDLN